MTAAKFGLGLVGVGIGFLVLIPGAQLAVTGAKDVNLYVVDRDHMGKFNATGDSNYQEIVGAFIDMVFSKPAYFGGTVYFGASSDALKAFPIVNGRLAATPRSQTANKFYYPGTTPTISANGGTEGIVWAVDNGPATGTTAVLFAYDAANNKRLTRCGSARAAASPSKAQ